MKLLGDHVGIMFHLRIQRKDGDRTVCRFFIRVTGANLPVFRSLENAHFGADFYAVFRDGFTHLHETCTKGHRWCKNGDAALSSSLFIGIQKKSSLTGAAHGCFGSHRGGESSTSEAGLKKRLQVLLTAR